MRPTRDLQVVAVLGCLTSCQEHVCHDDPARCDVLNIKMEPSRLALSLTPDLTNLQLKIRFGGDAFAEVIPVTIRQENQPPLELSLERSPADRTQYILKLAPVIDKIKLGELVVDFHSTEIPNAKTVLFDSEPFVKMKQILVSTTNINDYKLTAAYSLSVAGPTSTIDPPSAKYLMAFGAIGTDLGNESIKYSIAIGATGATPVLDPSATMMASYAYNLHANTWLGGTVYDATARKLWFYFGQADTPSDKYKLLRCPDIGNTSDNCAMRQTTVSAGIGSGTDADYRSLAVDTAGKLVALTNGPSHEAYQFNGAEFSRVPMKSGLRLRQMAVGTLSRQSANLIPDIFAIGEDSSLFWYRYISDAEGFADPVPIYKLANVLSGATALTIGDVNGDGLPDIVLAADKTIKFLLNTGASPAGSFTLEVAPYTLSATSTYRIRSLALSDIDGNGRQDIIAASDQGLMSPASAVEFFLSNRN